MKDIIQKVKPQQPNRRNKSVLTKDSLAKKINNQKFQKQGDDKRRLVSSKRRGPEKIEKTNDNNNLRRFSIRRPRSKVS